MTFSIPTRTISLRERVPRLVRLSATDAAFLAEQYRPRIELVPTTRRHVYRLTALGCAGVLVAPTCRFVIAPKIPLRSLLLLLDPFDDAPSVPDTITPSPGEMVLEFLAVRLARLLTERVAVGLQRGYVEQQEEGPFLRGKLDVPAQMREGAAHRERLHSRADDFTVDVPCNRLPKATAEHLLALPFLREDVQTALRLSLRGFSEVTSVPVRLSDLDRALTTAPVAYRPLLGLCRLLVEAASGGESGPVPAPAFLLDMERVFERFLTERLLAAFGDSTSYRVVPQSTFDVSEPAGLTMRPDLALTCEGRPVVLVDAKWKRLDKLVTDDVYQMIAYCAGIGVRDGVLVYPGGRDRKNTYRLTGSDVTLTVRTIKVNGDRESLRSAVARLARFLRRCADRRHDERS